MTDPAFVRRVSPLIADLGFRYYFAAEATALADRLGTDIYTLYFLGRGGVLGDVEPAVVTSAFGYFNPEVVAGAWLAGREVLPPREAAREHLACCAAFGRRHLGEVDGLDELCAALERVHAAASLAVAGLALYAGFAAEPLPEDLPGRAMHLIAVLREHRGSVHLLAVVAAGMDPALAHLVHRPGMWRTFGWRPDQKPAVTGLDRRRLAEVEATTDRLVAPAYDVLDAGEQRRVVEVLLAAKDAVGDDGALTASG